LGYYRIRSKYDSRYFYRKLGIWGCIHLIDHEYLRKWALVIAIASAVTAFGARYAVLEYKIVRLDKAVDDISRNQAYIDHHDRLLDKIEDKLNRLHAHQSERYEDE
jgi:hypothetical protein